MKLHEVQQGTPAWHALRAGYFTASEASAMMGVSKYMTRQELLRNKATGFTADVSPATQKLFDRGHATEESARAIAEQMIGEDLYPATVSDDTDYLLASLDGMTMDGGTIFEHKLLNADLVADLGNGIMPECHKWQVVQCLLVSGAERCLFAVSDGTEENFHHIWVTLDFDDVTKLMAGWKQFDEDLQNYQHVEEAPKVVAAAVLDLPAVSVQVSGQLAIINNFDVFEAALRDFIDNQLIRQPETDQDFADLDTQIKTLKKAEKALDDCETQMLSQVSSVDAMKRTKDMLHKLTRENRLMAEKLLESEKVARRVAIQEAGKKAYAEHIDALNKRLGQPYMPSLPVDFVGATKGLKSMDSAKAKVADELARAKIAANEVADLIDANLKHFHVVAWDSKALFADLQSLITKQRDDFAAVVKMRIQEHAAAEQAKADALREQIRQEEEAKLRAEQAAAEKDEEDRQASIRQQMREQELAEGMPPQEAPAKIPTMGFIPPKPHAADKAPARPSDEEIIEALVWKYRVHESKVIEWLLDMDLTAASQKMAANL